jgi:hypothetical protein
MVIKCPFVNCNLKCKSKKLHRATYAMMDMRRRGIVKYEPYESTTINVVNVSDNYTYIPMFYEEKYMVPPPMNTSSILFTQVKQRPIRTNLYA